MKPAKVPHLLTEDALLLKPGFWVTVAIPVSEIISVEDTRQGSGGLLLEKDEHLGIMYMLTGSKNKLLLRIKEPVAVKGLRNYGYADKFVFNMDEPALLKDFLNRLPKK